MAQKNEVAIAGKVLSTFSKPLPYASVTIVSVKDSLVARTVVSRDDGIYEIQLTDTGQYRIQATAMGYKPVNSMVISVVDYHTYQKDIVLEAEEKRLQNVTVTARTLPIQIKADRTILNVAASINATGYSAFELLAKAPGVRILNNEDIAISGKTGVVVYLDGKMLQIQGQEVITFLQTLPSANIESIEIITHPSARYDAAGSAGIINIRTKKIFATGLNGNATVTGIATAFKPKIEGNTNLNFRQKKYNLYSTYSYTGGNYRTQLEDNRAQQVGSAGVINFSQHYRSAFSRKVMNYKAGADYFISKKSTVGLVINGSHTKWLYDRSSLTDIAANTATIDSQLISRTVQPKNYTTKSANVNYLFHDTSGREFTVDANYGQYHTSANTDQTNRYVKGAGVLRSNANKNTNEAVITIAAVKADYTQKFRNGNWSMGVKASTVQSDNDLLFYNVVADNLLPDTGRTNHFVYTEKILSGYFDYNLSMGDFDFQAGLRWEHTRSSGNLATILRHSTQAVDTAYTNLFPNLVVNYKADNNNNLGLAISRRINRPAYQTLNPFEFVLDELSHSKGNPFLKPKLSYDIKLTHSYKGKLTTSLAYSITQNYFLNYRDTLAGGKTFNTTLNAGTQEFYVASTSLQISPKPWWDVFVYTEAFYQIINGRVNTTVLKQGQLASETSGSNTFRFGKFWSAELSGYWNSRYYDAPATVRGQWSVDAGLQRKLWNETATLRFNATDVFGSLKYSVNRNYGGLYYSMVNRYESRQYRLSFSYKFGNKNIKAARKQANSAAEEQGRVSQ